MTKSTTLERVVDRSITYARHGFHLSNVHAGVLRRVVGEAQRVVAKRPGAQAFFYRGVRFRLHRFDGWLIVLSWRGQPVAGPVRIVPTRLEGEA